MSAELNPREIKKYLRTQSLGNQIILLKEVDSTQNYAKLHLSDLNTGALLIAESQTQGRGRWGRKWHSVYGKGIYLSLVLKDAFSPLALSQLTLLASLSLAKNLESKYRLGFKVRWPNDVVLGKEKIAGTLAEISLGALILGIGLNVNQNLQELPDLATSIFLQTGKEEDRNPLLAGYLNQLEEDLSSLQKQGHIFLRRLWFSFSSLKDKEVVARTDQDLLEGKVEELSWDGGLILRGGMGYQFKLNLNELKEIRLK